MKCFKDGSEIVARDERNTENGGKIQSKQNRGRAGKFYEKKIKIKS